MNDGHDSEVYKHELLDLLRRIDLVLNKCGVEYFAVYGTCLGAVREHQIIPWDDDIDIAVWREDFSRTLKILSESSEQIYAGDRTTVPGCPSRCGRIFNRVGHKASIEKRRAYIDLHVIDHAPKSNFHFYLSVLCYVGVSRIIQKRLGVLCDHHKYAYKFADVLAFPLRIFSTGLLTRLADWVYIYKSPSSLVKITFDGNRKRYSAEVFSRSERVCFSGQSIPVPIGYDEYLTQCYGDWRTPPPKSERFSHAFTRDGSSWTVPIPADYVRPLH